jgi:hypothetical protein
MRVEAGNAARARPAVRRASNVPRRLPFKASRYAAAALVGQLQVELVPEIALAAGRCFSAPLTAKFEWLQVVSPKKIAQPARPCSRGQDPAGRMHAAALLWGEPGLQAWGSGQNLAAWRLTRFHSLPRGPFHPYYFYLLLRSRLVRRLIKDDD